MKAAEQWETFPLKNLIKGSLTIQLKPLSKAKQTKPTSLKATLSRRGSKLMRNSFCGTPHIPFKVYFTVYIPACNTNQMWQRSLTSPVKDARMSQFRRGSEKKAKGTWSWREGWGCSYNLRSILNSISVTIRKWISVGNLLSQAMCTWNTTRTARFVLQLENTSTWNPALQSDSLQQGWRDSAVPIYRTKADKVLQ